MPCGSSSRAPTSPGRARVRMLPDVLPATQLPGADETGARIPFGIDESTLSPVSLDFSTDPHFLVLGDIECGKSSLLRLIADGIVARYPPEQARLIVIDYRRSLLDAADTEHRIGYAASPPAAASLVSDARGALIERLPSANLTADVRRARSCFRPRTRRRWRRLAWQPSTCWKRSRSASNSFGITRAPSRRGCIVADRSEA